MVLNFIRKVLLPSMVILITVASCKKEDEQVPDLSAKSKLAIANINAIAGAPTPDLDWENISFMPTPAGVAAIPVPWQGGLGGAKIDDDMIFDYKKSDGWELVYNTFNTTTTFNPSYFMLYNKYRGVLRTYFYVAPGGNAPSSNLVHLLAVRGASASASPVLNFASQDYIDYSVNSLNVSQLQPYQVSASGSWYAAEFELAYDAKTAATSYDQVRLDWQINPNSIAAVSLNGTQIGDLSGTITSGSATSNFFSTVINGVVAAGLKVGADDVLTAKALNFLPAAVKTPIVTASQNAVAGLIKGFVSGIIGGNSGSSKQKVALKLNTNITMSGTATVGSQLFDNVFSLTGTTGVGNTLPYYPKYPDPMGVFYISAKPVVTRTVQSTLQDDGVSRNYLVDQRYSVNESSFQLVFNTAVTNIATISNIRKEVVMMKVPSTSTITRIGGVAEQVADKLIYTGASTGIESVGPRPLTISVDLAIRITFDVVPKDGSPKCTIVKTFLATQG